MNRERVLACVLRHRAVEYNWGGSDFQRQVRISLLPGSCIQVKRVLTYFSLEGPKTPQIDHLA